MSGPLHGRVVLVTGGGRGIGRAHALEFAAQGAAVVVCDIGADLDGRGGDDAVAEQVAAEVRGAGGAAVADTTDISTFAGGERAVQRALDAFGRIDIVVNNAGLAGSATIETVTEADLERLMSVNFYGAVGVARAAWPHLVRQGWGRVINTVSEVALDDKFAGASFGYGAAKAAVWSFTLSLAREGRPHGITANAISPGAFTRMNEALFAQVGRPALDLDPAHVARLAVWLAGDEAAEVTGRVLHAAGGQVREYLTRRVRDTELASKLSA